MRCILLLASALLSLAPLSASAAEPAPLTLGEAARAALAVAPRLALARAEQEAALAEEAEARAALLPALSLAGGLTQFEKPVPVEPIHGFRPDLLPEFDHTVIQPSLRASYTLFDGGARAARIEGASAQAASLASRLAAEEQAVLRDTALAYLRVLSLAELLAADEKRLAGLDAELDRVGKLLAVGRAAAVDLARATAARAAAEADRATRAARLELAEKNLATLTGEPRERVRAGRLPKVAEVPPAMPDSAALLERALARSPLLAAAKDRLRAAEAALALARAAKRPAITAQASETGYSGSDLGWSAEWSAGVSLSLPLATGGATDARIRRAAALVARAEAEIATLEEGLRNTIDQAQAGLAEAAARGRSLEAAAASYAEVVRIEGLKLAHDSGTQTDFLAAEALLAGALAARVEARFAELGSHLELARAAGELDLDWLRRTLEGSP